MSSFTTPDGCDITARAVRSEPPRIFGRKTSDRDAGPVHAPRGLNRSPYPSTNASASSRQTQAPRAHHRRAPSRTRRGKPCVRSRAAACDDSGVTEVLVPCTDSECRMQSGTRRSKHMSARDRALFRAACAGQRRRVYTTTSASTFRAITRFPDSLRVAIHSPFYRLFLRGREHFLELAVRVHLLEDVVPADELAVQVELRDGGPVAERLQHVPEVPVVRLVQRVDRFVVH